MAEYGEEKKDLKLVKNENTKELNFFIRLEKSQSPSLKVLFHHRQIFLYKGKNSYFCK